MATIDLDEEILDALANGASIRAVAKQYGVPEHQVRTILQEDAERTFDGAQQRQEWALASRRLLAMELAFHKKALTEMCPTSAIVALKSNERRSAIQGGGSAAPSHLLLSIQQRAVEESETSTQKLARVLRELRGEPAAAKPD